jgi:excisionase family DNA binding protein
MTRPTKAPEPPLLLRPEQGAEMLQISRSLMYRLLRTGEIASVKIGKARRISPEALAAYVQRLQQDTPSPDPQTGGRLSVVANEVRGA